MPRPLTFNACGNAVYWRGYALSDAQVHRLTNFFWDRQIEARNGGDERTLTDATDLCGQLLDAHTQASRWRRCALSGFSGALVDQSENQTKGEAA